ncbi:MAG: hypothetical protein AAFZ52_18965, partial [Bacteroidota bacterium]
MFRTPPFTFLGTRVRAPWCCWCLFSLFLLVCSYLPAQGQLSVRADLGLVSDWCTGGNADPIDNCGLIPTGNDYLNYLPGVDGEILITYRIENVGTETVTELNVRDDDRGQVLNPTPLRLLPGQTYALRVAFPAETRPRTVTPTVFAIGQTARGAYRGDGNYTLEVAAPQLTLPNFGLGRTAATVECSAAGSRRGCFAASGTTQLTAGRGDSL